MANPGALVSGAEGPAKTKFSDLWNALLEIPRHELVLKLTILMLLMYGGGAGALNFPMRVIAGLMLIGPGWHLSRYFWPWLLFFTGAANLGDWFTMDNHRFLILYWTVACTFSVFTPDPDRILAWNGRLLIALTFVAATGWKALAGDYLNGEFFYYAFLGDSRLKAVASLATGLSNTQLVNNQELFTLMRYFPVEGFSVELTTTELTRLSGTAMSWATLAIEGAVAFGFVYALVRKAGAWVDWLLIAFCWATYTIAPIVGFGLILTIMGLAQASKDNEDVRWAYLLTFVVVQLSLAYVVRHLVLMAG